MSSIILLRGGGDLATGVALRLHRTGLRLLVTELPEPLAVRRMVSFSEAVYRGEMTVEGITARRAAGLEEALSILHQGQIPILVDPQASVLARLKSTYSPPEPAVIIDARMTKRPPELGMAAAPLVIGLGPGFIAGENCHAVIETNRGHYLGRALWNGAAEKDTGVPERVIARSSERVLRSPADGVLRGLVEIGDRLEPGQPVAAVDGQTVPAPFKGVLRGLLHPGLAVTRGMKIGDVDPRDDPRYCWLVSDKSLAIAGGVLEAILSRPDIRLRLWD